MNEAKIANLEAECKRQQDVSRIPEISKLSAGLAEESRRLLEISGMLYEKLTPFMVLPPNDNAEQKCCVCATKFGEELMETLSVFSEARFKISYIYDNLEV